MKKNDTQNLPLISVITPCYNLEKYLAATIKSLQDQTMENWEMIIVDDLSSDDSFEIAIEAAKEDSRITAVQHEKNSGSSKARNTALNLAKGKYITFIDGDDLIKPFKFEAQINYMERNGYDITYTNYRRMTPDEKTVGVLQRNPFKIRYKYLLKHTALGTLTPIYNREKIGEYFFDENLPARMDYAFWLDVLKDGHVAYRFDRDMARYRRGHVSLSSNINRGRKIVWQIHRQRNNLSFMRASWYYINYVFHALKKRGMF